MKKQDHGPKSSWEKVSTWYGKTVNEEGSYFHQKIIFPNLLKIWNLESFDKPSVLDLACGQGVLSRQIRKEIPYLGIDASATLLKQAKSFLPSPKHRFMEADLSKPLKIHEPPFSHAAIILAIQNIEDPERVFKNAASLLGDQGILSIVLNHPCFRIPRQSGWGVDEEKKLQYRRLDSYMSTMTIPIEAHPGDRKKNTSTLSFHFPLSTLVNSLAATGFAIIRLDEWCSDKTSEGGRAKMENRARKEFPLFLHIMAKKWPKK